LQTKISFQTKLKNLIIVVSFSTLDGFTIMTKTQTYEKLRTFLRKWREEDVLAKVGKFFSMVLTLNREPKELAEALNELTASPSRPFEFTLSICLVLAMWAARPLNADGAAYLAYLLESLANERVEARLLEIFPLSVTTSLPGFKPSADREVDELKRLIRQGGLEESEIALANQVLNFLAERSNRFQ
jgi:hypothetical protein